MKSTELLLDQACRGAYGVDVGDFNGDGLPDIVIGRRLNEGFFALFQAGQRDTVVLNHPDAINHPGEHFWDMSSAYRIYLPNSDVLGQSEEMAQTFGIEVADLDGATGTPQTHTLDIVCTGAYGIRVYRGNGNGTFSHGSGDEFREAINGVPTVGSYRNIAFGDVDSDGDIDMFVPRAAVDGVAVFPVADRIWYNQSRNALNGVLLQQYQLFQPLASGMGGAPVTPSPFLRPPVLCFNWKTSPSASAQSSGTCLLEQPQSVDADFGDIDNDGDLDLVIVSPTSNNALYLNNGSGLFGSSSASADGCPAYVFSSPTPDWPSTDPNAYSTCEIFWYVASQLGLIPPLNGSQDYLWRGPGKLLDQTSSVRIRDLNGDGWKDIVFANRNDYQELAYKFRYAYLDPVVPGPRVYDHVYYGKPPGLGESFAFCSKVENVGNACDGTSYIEFVDIGSNRKPDWIEANFSNNYFVDPYGYVVGPLLYSQNPPSPGGYTNVWYSSGVYSGQPPCGY